MICTQCGCNTEEEQCPECGIVFKLGTPEFTITIDAYPALDGYELVVMTSKNTGDIVNVLYTAYCAAEQEEDAKFNSLGKKESHLKLVKH